jgi:hypothetical protein
VGLEVLTAPVGSSDERARVTIEGQVVARPAGPWTPAVHALLGHLRRSGLLVPQPLGVQDRVERLRLIPGESGARSWPHQATESGLRSAARLLRRVHDATQDWPAPANSAWAVTRAPHGFGGPRVICHGDPGPWNMIWREGAAVGLLDWDQAHPGHALEDVGYALEYLTPFRSDREAVRWLGFPEPPNRRHRLAGFAQAYGLDGVDGLVDVVIERQRLTIRHVQELADLGVEPQRRWTREGFLDELVRRVEWSSTHRHLVE